MISLSVKKLVSAFSKKGIRLENIYGMADSFFYLHFSTNKGDFLFFIDCKKYELNCNRFRELSEKHKPPRFRQIYLEHLGEDFALITKASLYDNREGKIFAYDIVKDGRPQKAVELPWEREVDIMLNKLQKRGGYLLDKIKKSDETYEWHDLGSRGIEFGRSDNLDPEDFSPSDSEMEDVDIKIFSGEEKYIPVFRNFDGLSFSGIANNIDKMFELIKNRDESFIQESKNFIDSEANKIKTLMNNTADEYFHRKEALEKTLDRIREIKEGFENGNERDNLERAKILETLGELHTETEKEMGRINKNTRQIVFIVYELFSILASKTKDIY